MGELRFSQDVIASALSHAINDAQELWPFTGLDVPRITQQYASFEAQLQFTLNVIPAYTWYASPSGGLTFVNNRQADYLGLPKDHPLRFGLVTGVEWDSHIPLLHPDDREETCRVWSTCLRTGSAGQVAFRVRNAEGGFRWFLSRAEPLRANDGTLLYWIGVNLDIEERKQAEIELRRSKAHLADAQRLSRVGSVGMEGSMKRIFWSEEAARIYGYPPGTEPTPDLILQRVHPDDVDLLKNALERAAQGGTDFEFEHRLLMPDGSIKHIYNLSHSSRDDTGKEEAVGAIMDITERRLAEEAIRLSEAYLAEAQKLSHTGSFGWRPKSGEIVWSNETYRIFEYDCTKKPTLEMVLQRVHPEDRFLVQEIIERASNAGLNFEHECRLLIPNGAIKHIHVRANALQAPCGKTEFIGAVTDITERKHAEEELQQLVDFVCHIITVISPIGKIIYANRVAREYTGLTLDEYRSVDVLARVIHPDDVQRMRAVRERGLSANNPFEIEARTLGRGGVCRWFLYRYNPLCDERGQVTRWYVTGTDIEDRKQAEDRLRQENVALREEIDHASMFEDIVGTSSPLQTVLSSISKVAPSDSTVLITGETGTGKELVARAIHRRSQRSSQAFISVNCAATPRELIASELFGHEKGSFTGATQRRLGRFELASGGTIFLDEVGELPAETQIALLRVLQEREFERVGGCRPIRADVRVIAATNRDLQGAISAGTFRSDLFYRLHVFPIEIPPLRARREDIPLLAEYFIDRYARKAGKRIKGVNKKTLKLLESYPWPGNIRELQNVIERSVILCETEIFSIDESWLPQQPLLTEPKTQAELHQRLQAQEKDIIEAALHECEGRVFGPSGAAAKLGIPRSTLESKIRSLKINKNRFKTADPSPSI